MSPHDAIAHHLPALLARLGRDEAETIDLMNNLPERLAWITWSQIRQVVEDALPPAESTSSEGSVHRMGTALIQAVDWHS